MSLVNDENELQKCLNEIILIIEQTVLEESSFTNELNSNRKKLEELTNILNVKLKNSLSLLSDQYRQYFLYLFKDYNYSFDKGIFNETIKSYILKDLINDLQAIRDSFDAFQAAFDGNLSIVRYFIEKYPKYKDKSGIWGTTLLYSSSRNNHIHIVKYLIEQANCNVNVQNYSLNKQLNPTSGSTPLHAACFYGNLNIVKYLIENNADYFIENDTKETPIYNGLLRENIKEFFQDFLIFSYSNVTNNPPQSTILNANYILFDSIWEYKAFYSDQWILFDQYQSNQLQQSLIYQPNKNYNQNLTIQINNQSFSISIIQFLCFNKSDKEYLWIRSRGSAILNFNCYSKWQIMFQNDSPNKIFSLDVFNIDDNQNIQMKIKHNCWYNANDYLQQQLEHAINYRKRSIHIYLHFINNHLFQFDLKTFSFSNHDNTISGFIRWIPIFIQNNDQTIIDNFQPLDNLFLIPKYRTHSNDQLTTTSNHYSNDQLTTISNHHSESMDCGNDNVSMDVRFGDLVKETSDVIVVCWSSEYLLRMIYDCGGSSVRSAVNNQLQKNLKNNLTSVKSDGDIKSKRIYFIYWQAESQIELVKKSIENLISIAMRKAHDDNYQSIAFPAIGCGHDNYPIDIIAQTMVNKVHQEQIYHKISVSFIIQSDKKDLFNHFNKQIHLLNSSISMNFISTNIQNSVIQIEKGDLTKQKVDVIVVSSSSDYLRQIVLIEAGQEIYEYYEKESNSNPNNLLISTPSGNLLCKRIFFLKWNPDENENNLRQSINDFIWNVIQNVLSYQYDSIAFPPIGCGHSNISTQIIIQTLINQLINQIKSRNLSLIIKFIILPDQNQIYQLFYQQLLSSEQNIQLPNDDQLPSTWELSAGKKYRFLVSIKSDEFKKIQDEFNRAMKGKLKNIIRIERIQNERWYFQYLAHKKDFFKRLNKDTEKRLYHGCPQHVQNSIIEDCFNRSFAGVNGTAYGFGVYFSSDAIYSNQFSKPNSNGEKSMFIARVLIGNSTLGNPSMKTRPPGYDTTTDGNHIYVTYHDAQAYAEYLITYK